MKRAAFVSRVRPGKEAEYVEVHNNVWPELIEAARAAGFQNHTVFMKGQTLFLYVECNDFERSSKDYLASPIKKKWDAYMSQYLMSSSEEESEDLSEVLEEIFHFD